MNLVRIRYADSVAFLDVTSVINQYEREARAGVNILPGGDGPSGDLGTRVAERPTVTYAPIAGERLAKTVLRPAPPVALAVMAQSGWPLDFVLDLAVESINGINNGSALTSRQRVTSPEFSALMGAARTLQSEGAIGFSVKRSGSTEALFIELDTESGKSSVQDAIATVRRLLKLSNGVNEYRLEYESHPQSGAEIAIVSRSMLQIMAELSAGVEIPATDLAEGRALQVRSGETIFVRVKQGGEPPDARDANVSVRYRDKWFWIDDRDLGAKRVFSFLLMLFSIAESTGQGLSPVVTISTGR